MLHSQNSNKEPLVEIKIFLLKPNTFDVTKFLKIFKHFLSIDILNFIDTCGSSIPNKT